MFSFLVVNFEFKLENNNYFCISFNVNSLIPFKSVSLKQKLLLLLLWYLSPSLYLNFN